MSQPAIGQSQRNEPVGDDSRTTPNGVENTNHSESAPIDAPNFGIFHVQIEREVQKLEDGLETIGGAIAELTKTFSHHGKIVKAVGERWGKDQVLEEEIRDLKVQNAGIWNNIAKDRRTHEKEISDLKKEHAHEVSKLEAEAEAGKQEKEKYEEMERRRADQHKKAIQSMDRELKQKGAQMEKENAEKIAALVKAKVELEDTKTKLKQRLEERTKELDQEKQTRSTMQDKLSRDVQGLQEILNDIKAKYKMDNKPLEFYLDKYRGLAHSVNKIATSYFTNLPDKAIDDPAVTSARLTRKAQVFAKIPIAESDCSQVLRLANVQHVIFNVICGSFWQPFFSKYLLKHKWDRLAFAEIYSRLEAWGEDVQQNWKVSTLRMLDQLDDGVDVGEQVDAIIYEKVVVCLQPLLEDSRADQFMDELKVIFTDAIELGKMAERDQLPVYIDTTPSLNDPDGWKEYLDEDYERSDLSELSANSPTMDSPFEPLFVAPKIFRRAARAAPRGLATTSNTTTAIPSRPEIEVIQPGLALFPRTGIFLEGSSVWQKISNAGREAAKNINGKARRQSMNMSITSSATTLRSPTQPSKKWSPEGAQDYN